MKLAIVASLLVFLALAGCDDDSNNAANQGGGPGSSDPNTVAAPGAGFCQPQGGSQALGQSSFDSGSTVAKIDTDGNPAEQGLDPDWNPGTAGSVNGQAVNSAQYAYVVMSPEQMNSSGVALGDWATVTNSANGQTVYARVEDKGPPGGTGEISQAAAAAVGIQSTVVQTKYGPSTVTVGNPSVTVDAYAGTSAIQSDCAANIASDS